MAKFISTRKAVSEIEELIKNAGERLILVSPYLKLSKDFKELLTYRNKKDKVTTVIFGKQELNPDEMKFLQELRFVVLKYNEDLHAKCYLNDDKMVITSLNLYEFSMANNKEMGVLIDKNDPADTQLYEDAFKEVDFINEEKLYKIRETYKSADDYWMQFRREFGNKCIRSYSIPYFNKEKNICIIITSMSCGPLEGGGNTAIFKKINGKWKVIQTLDQWVS